MSEEPTRIAGTFCPPDVPDVKIPLPIGGDGFIECRPDAFFISGFKSAQTSWKALGTMGIILVCGALYLLTPPSIALTVGGALGLLYLFGMTRKTSVVRKAPLELAIPWKSVKDAKRGKEPGEVLIFVVKHKPKGPVHFKPADGDVDGLIQLVQSAVAAHR